MLWAEIRKVRGRWMPYVILLVAIGGAAAQIWAAGYGAWTGEDDPFFRSAATRAFALPWGLVALLDSGQFWGAMLVGVLASSVVATEDSWGTVRLALVLGQPRWRYLAVKLLGIGVVATLMLLAALAVGVAFSAWATSLADMPITLDPPGPDSVSAGEVPLMMLRAAYALLPYGTLAFCLAVVGRSTTMGIAGTIFYLIGESIMLAVLAGIGGIAEDVRAFLMGHNVVALLAENRIGPGDFNSFAPRQQLLPADTPDPWVAALVLALYSVAFLAIAFAVFQRRDIRS